MNTYPSLVHALQQQAAIRAPDHWTCFRQAQLSFELRHPPDWRIDAGDHLTLVPSFAEEIWETPTHYLWSPAVTLLVLVSKSQSPDPDTELDRVARNLPEGFARWNFRWISEERAQFSDRRALYLRFAFDRAGSPWEAFMVSVPYANKIALLDASGRTGDLSRHRTVLEQVISTFRVTAKPETHYCVTNS